MSDFGRPPVVDTQIIPVVARTAPGVDRRDQWSNDRTGRFVLVGLVFALAFLFVAAAIWWAGGGRGPSNDALAAGSPEIAPVTVPATVVDDANAASDGSAMALSPAPMPTRALALTGTAQAAPPPPAPAQPAPPPATEAPVPPATEADTTTTAPTTTVATTTGATTTRPSTTVAGVVVTRAPATTVATTTATTTTTTTTTTTSPTTTVPATAAPTTAPAPATSTLLDLVNDTPDLARLRELIELSGFAPELDAARELTFLAPSNAAIDAWSATPEGQATLADPDAVYDLLLRHLVPEAFDSEAIFSRTSLPTVSGATLAVSQESHTIDGADLLVVDVDAANGYLHVVSDVLIAP